MNATTAAVLADAGPPPPTGGDEPPAAAPAPLGVFFLGYVVIGTFGAGLGLVA